ILDREAREGRPLGSSLPHVIVNDPYRTVIPPLTQQEIRATAQYEQPIIQQQPYEQQLLLQQQQRQYEQQLLQQQQYQQTIIQQ
ncbi:unnamed protein product, partial [Rotaria sp. Silwood1]